MKKSILIIFFFLGLIISCSEDEELTISISDFEVTIDENPITNQLLGIVKATTNQGGNIIFSIIEQSPNNAFQINTSTGQLTVLTESLFDFETQSTITGTIKAENGNISETANVLIRINNVEDTAVITKDLYLMLDENPNPNQVLGIIDATTTQGVLEFSITQQSNENALQVNTNTGQLTVLTTNLFDYETYPLITASIKVDNGYESEIANVTIDLKNVDEITISNFEVTIDENPNPNQTLGTINASTSQGNLTFSITNQTPTNAFQINTSTGELTVLTESLFNFEDNTTITGIVSAENGYESKNINITINLNDVFENSIEITDIFDTYVQGITTYWRPIPNENFKNFENSSYISIDSWTSTYLGEGVCKASRGLLKFKYSNIPTNINITNVKLVLQKSGIHIHSSTGSIDDFFKLKLINSSWELSEVNWENQPSTTTNQTVFFSSQHTENSNIFDITNLFLKLYNNQNTYQGLMLEIKEHCIFNHLGFYSSDYSDVSKRPKLIIQYN
tara:strand:+ start:2091 stop:3614 length:1524 start_codon:yes stop_codon:yes gene_type:complete